MRTEYVLWVFEREAFLLLTEIWRLFYKCVCFISAVAAIFGRQKVEDYNII